MFGICGLFLLAIFQKKKQYSAPLQVYFKQKLGCDKVLQEVL